MSEYGSNFCSPPNRLPKKGADSKRADSAGSKCIKEQSLQFGRPSDIGSAPPNRIYTRDYTKVGRSKGDVDLVTAALGNPLGL